VEDEGTAVDIFTENVDDLKAEPVEEGHEWFQGIVLDVLMVDGIEGGPLEDVQEVHRLNDEDPIVGQKRIHPPDEVVKIVDVEEDAGRRNGPRLPPLADDAGGTLPTKEGLDGLDPRIDCDPGDLVRRLDAEDTHPMRAESLEPGTVVAADIHDQGIVVERIPPHDLVGELVEVIAERPGGAGHIGVVQEHDLARDRVTELDESAVRAKVEIQGIDGFPLLELIAAKEAVAVRLVSQGKKVDQVLALADSARSHSVRLSSTETQ